MITMGNAGSLALLALITCGTWAHAANNPPPPTQPIHGYTWKLEETFTVGSGVFPLGPLVSVDIESLSTGSASALLATGAYDQSRIYAYKQASPGSTPAWHLEISALGGAPSLSNNRVAFRWHEAHSEESFVRVYERDSNGNWAPMGLPLRPSLLDSPGLGIGAVRLHGDLLVVGLPNYQSLGRAVVYECVDGLWFETAILGDEPGVQSMGSHFGATIAVGDGFIAVEQTPGGVRGQVRIYNKAAGDWTLSRTLFGRNPDHPEQSAGLSDIAADAFGQALMANGTQLAVRSRGYVQLFQRTRLAGEWTFKESFNTYDTPYPIRSLAFDGSSLLVGHPELPAEEQPSSSGRVQPLLGPTARPINIGFPPAPGNADFTLITPPPLPGEYRFGNAIAVNGPWLIVSWPSHRVGVYKKTAY